MTDENMSMLEAMTFLYAPLLRQGPGDDAFALALLNRLPKLPFNPHIADLGCGTGHSSLLLAEHFNSQIISVDFLHPFLEKLQINAEERGLGSLITTHCEDMGELGPDFDKLDLLWSEGAAYDLTFAGALEAWHPLMNKGGIAVISEMSWFGDIHPLRAAQFWDQAYPQMEDEAGNLAHARTHGYEPLFTEKLPTSAWWANFYDPLLQRVDALSKHPDPVLQEILAETRQEADIFAQSSDHLGYIYYALKVV